MSYELKPNYVKQKSFYGKATVSVDTGGNVARLCRPVASPDKYRAALKYNRKKEI